MYMWKMIAKEFAIEVDGVQHYKSIEHWVVIMRLNHKFIEIILKMNTLVIELIRINNKKIKEIDIIWQQLQKKKQNVK